jgi:lipoprotein-releasing system permease protein
VRAAWLIGAMVVRSAWGFAGDLHSGRVYHSLLTRRYLTSKIMPLLASVAVMLCTGMVVLVWSVMGGFLTHLIGSGRSLVGDAQIAVPGAGFPHYEELQRRLEALSEVEATSAAIETQALMVLPGSKRDLVVLRGIDGPSFARVSAFGGSLWWRPLDEPTRKDVGRTDPRLNGASRSMYEAMHANGKTLTVIDPDTGQPTAAAILGIEVTDYNFRTQVGTYVPEYQHGPTALGSRTGKNALDILPMGNKISLHVLPMDATGAPLGGETRRFDFPVANEFHTGVYEIDRKTVLVRVDALQRALRMEETLATTAMPGAGAVKRDANGNEQFVMPTVVGRTPGRVTTVYVRAKEDVGTAAKVDAFKKRLQGVVEEFVRAFPDSTRGGMPRVSSWRDQNRTMIAAVEKELGLVLFLFAIISVVAIFLVLAIFWSMVAEKTKDIGILRAVGASRLGVAWVWVRYGFVIGVVGAVGGGVMSYLIVTNINEIHDWLGESMGLYVWDPKVYYFSEIPAKFKWIDASIVLVSGVVASGVGAFIPAMRAARMDPVRALRFE